MVALAILALDRSIRDKIKRIQDLKRRVLFLEDDNPISLFEPDLEEIISAGKIVNAVARNKLDEELPDTVFQANGNLRFSNDATVDERKAILLFEKSVDFLGGIYLNLSDIITSYLVPSSTRIVNDNTITITIEQVPAFDPTTVTWNNQNDPFPPGGTGESIVLTFTWGRVNTAEGLTLDTASTATVTWTATPHSGNIIFPGSDWIGTSALLISVQHSIGFNEPTTTGEINISPTFTGGTGISTGQGSTGQGPNLNSSILIDLGFGSQVKCTGVPTG